MGNLVLKVPNYAFNVVERFWYVLSLVMMPIPLLASHQAEFALWRSSTTENTVIVDLAKIEVLLVDIALGGMLAMLFGILIFFPQERRSFFLDVKHIATKLGGGWWLLLVAWSALSALWAPEPILTLYRSTHLLVAICMAGILAVVIKRQGELWLLIGFILAALLQGVIGIGQALNDAPLGLTIVQELQNDPTRLLEQNDGRLRGYGLTLHPNILAGFLMIAIHLLALTINKRFVKRKLIYLPIATILIIGILATGARLVMLIVFINSLIITGIWFWSGNRRIFGDWWRTVFMMSISLIVVIIITNSVFPTLKNRILELRDVNGIFERATFGFTNTIPLIEENTLLGVGNGTSAIEIATTWNGSQTLLLPAHNAYLFIWSEIGAIGLFLCVLGIIALAGQVAMFVNIRWEAGILFLMLTSVFFVMCFDYYFWAEPRAQVLLFWLFGLVWGCILRWHTEAGESEKMRHQSN